jgi:hypothetical protein
MSEAREVRGPGEAGKGSSGERGHAERTKGTGVWVARKKGGTAAEVVCLRRALRQGTMIGLGHEKGKETGIAGGSRNA